MSPRVRLCLIHNLRSPFMSAVGTAVHGSPKAHKTCQKGKSPLSCSDVGGAASGTFHRVGCLRTGVFLLLYLGFKLAEFDNMPETWVIFITENDVIGKGLPLYSVERCFLDTGERFDDGSHILYVNGAYRGDTAIGKLMHDFSCTDAADMYYGVLAERVRFFKESKEGIEIMCRAMEDMRNQTLKEGAIDSAKRMLSDGILTLEKIAEYAGLSLDEVKKLKKE